MAMTSTAQGYGVEATLTPEALTIRATSRAGRISVFGPDPRDEVTIPLHEIASARHMAPPKVLLGAVNGVLVVRTQAGVRYQLNYRVRKNRDFRAFADAVVAAVTPVQSA
jgi:hypothetical protein